MKREFITPVSMPCSKEEYERDLKEPLRELGYEDIYVNEHGTLLITGNQGEKNYVKLVYNTHEGCFNSNIRTFIPTYNPEQFLALASMTKGDKPIVGEYIVYTGDNGMDLTIGKLYKVTYNKEGHDYTGVRDDADDLNGICYIDFKKPTKEEIIEHFSKDNFTSAREIWEKYHCPTLNKKHMKDKKESRFPFELDLEGVRKIIDVACNEWKEKLSVKWTFVLYRGKVEVTESFYKEMRAACNEEQHKVLDEVFGKDEKSVRLELCSLIDDELRGCTTRQFVNKLLETFNIEFKK